MSRSVKVEVWVPDYFARNLHEMKMKAERDAVGKIGFSRFVRMLMVMGARCSRLGDLEERN